MDEFDAEYEELLNSESDDQAFQFMQIDLALTDVVRSLEECFGWNERERYLVLQHLRIAYIDGYNECFRLHDQIMTTIGNMLRSAQ